MRDMKSATLKEYLLTNKFGTTSACVVIIQKYKKINLEFEGWIKTRRIRE